MATKKEPIYFSTSVPANGGKVRLTERIKGSGTIEEVRVRFFPGQQKALQVRPFVKHKGGEYGKIEELITYPSGGDQFLSGDDDNLIFDAIVPVVNDDEIVVEATNTDPDDAYTLHVVIMIDYYGGADRVV